MLLVVVGSVVLTLGTGSAGAAGDPKVDKLVVTFKAAGWTPWPTEDAKAVADLERKTMKAATSGTPLVGVKGWENDAGDRVFVVVVALADGIPGAEQNARAAVISTCANAVGESPTNQSTFKAGEAGSEGTCRGTSSSGRELDATVIAFVSGNTLSLVVGTGVTKQQMESLARRQAKAIPPIGVLR